MDKRIICSPSPHAELGASKADTWMPCPGSIALSAGVPRESSQYADEGTAAHKLLQLTLDEIEKLNRGPDAVKAAAWLGWTIVVGEREFTVDQEMVDHVQHVVDTVYQLADGGLVLSERQVNYNRYLQSRLSAFGTTDVLVVCDEELQVHDLKYGRGVAVSAEDNPQMRLYALGALAEIEDTLGPFTRVRLFIHQPRISKAPSEWSITVSELTQWGFGRARSCATSVVNAIDTKPLIDATKWEKTYLHAGEKQCRWCPAKATCPELAAAVINTVTNRDNSVASIDEFDALQVPTKKHLEPSTDDWLGAAMAKTDMIEDWIKAVRAEVERRLLAGGKVPGYKVVQGKQGDRAWTNPAEVEAELKKFRLKVEEMYDLKLISPTTAEKLAKAKTLGPRQWTALQAKIKRAPGRPHVAPADDKRPAMELKPVAEEFEALPASKPVAAVAVDDLC